LVRVKVATVFPNWEALANPISPLPLARLSAAMARSVPVIALPLTLTPSVVLWIA
jgi:hypothetical protein